MRQVFFRRLQEFFYKQLFHLMLDLVFVIVLIRQLILMRKQVVIFDVVFTIFVIRTRNLALRVEGLKNVRLAAHAAGFKSFSV